MRNLASLTVGLVLIGATAVSGQTVAADRFYLNTGPCLLSSDTGTPSGGATCDVYVKTGDGTIYRHPAAGFEPVPGLSDLNIWTRQQEIAASEPISYWTATGGAANHKTWRVDVDPTGTAWSVQTLNDAKSSVLSVPLQIDFSTSGVTIAAGLIAGSGAVGIIGSTGKIPALTTTYFTSVAFDASNLTSGTLPAGRMPALTGDVTSSAGSVATTLAAGSAGALNSGNLAYARMPSGSGTWTASPTISGATTFASTITSNLTPTTTDTYDLGTATALWRQANISQINATVFSLNTQTIFGGYSTVGKNAGLFAAAVASGNTTINFGQAMTPNDFVLVRAADTGGTVTAEYIQVGTLVSGTTYNVTRNLSGIGAKNWAMGVPYMVLGNSGDGRIDLLAFDGKPRILWTVQGATYNAQTDRIVIGDLNGYYGYVTSLRGAAMGDPTATNITIEPTNGFRIRSGTTDKFKADASGNLSLTGDLAMSTAGVFRAGMSAFGTGTGWWLDYNAGSPRFMVGNPSGDYFKFDGTNTKLTANQLTIDSNGVTIAPATTLAYVNINAYQWTVPTGNVGLSAFDFSSGTPSRGMLINANWSGSGNRNTSIELVVSGAAALSHTAYVFLSSPGATSSSHVDMAADAAIWQIDNITMTGTTLLVGNPIKAAASYLGATGAYVYPGSASGLVDYQTNYYLASHGSYGLYSNTGIALGGPIRQVLSAVMYPGSVSGLVNYQTTYYLASTSAAPAGLYTNGGFRTDDAIDAKNSFIGRAGQGGATSSTFTIYWTGTSAHLWIDTTDLGQIVVTSDRRVKKDIAPMGGVLAAVLQLNPVSFAWDNGNPNEGQGQQLGLLAQEVQPIFPSLVTQMTTMKTDKAPDGLYRVNYQELVPVLVKAIQELQAEIVDIRGRIK